MPRQKISQEIIDEMVDLWKDRQTTTAIARKLNLSYTSVYVALKRLCLVG